MFDTEKVQDSLPLLREKLNLSQRQFADRYKIPINNIRNWEQGVRKPGIAAAKFLIVIAAMPDEVAQILVQH